MKPVPDDENAAPAYAGIPARVGAYLVDCLILGIAIPLTQAILYALNPVASTESGGAQPTAAQVQLWVFATVTVPVLLYFALTQSSARQATLGMRLLKLKVAGASGGRLSVGRALLRGAVMLIPFELNHATIFHLMPRDGPPAAGFYLGFAAVWALIAVYLASIAFTPRRQSVHDLAAKTVVLRAG